MFVFSENRSIAPLAAMAAALALGIGAGLPAQAGENNILFIKQNSTAGGLGNSLTVDQSGAFNSTVAGLEGAPNLALQSGPSNKGDITLTGNGAVALFSQTNNGVGPVDANEATLEGGGGAIMVLDQTGIGNWGKITIGDGGKTGALFQYGDDNTGTVRVSGSGSSGTLYQKGDNNGFDLQVSGGASVQWNQIGSNLTQASSVSPAQVISNAGTVTVTQTSY